MKLIDTVFEQQKTVKLFGVKFNVPSYAKYASIDETGYLFVWGCKPVIDEEYESWLASEEGEQSEFIAIFDLEDTDWRTTLTEIK